MASRIAVINKGILQQIDTPQTLYDHPDNLFVAGFIGSPAMNFFNATSKERWQTRWLSTATLFSVQVPAERSRRVYGARGQAGDLRYPTRGHPQPGICTARHHSPSKSMRLWMSPS